jgi:hypothetical protein
MDLETDDGFPLHALLTYVAIVLSENLPIHVDQGVPGDELADHSNPEGAP